MPTWWRSRPLGKPPPWTTVRTVGSPVVAVLAFGASSVAVVESLLQALARAAREMPAVKAVPRLNKSLRFIALLLLLPTFSVGATL